MKLQQLKEFCSKQEVSYLTELKSREYTDVILFVELFRIKEFNLMLGASIMDDGGIECNMKHGYFCFHMKDICDYFGFELWDVIEKPVWNNG